MRVVKKEVRAKIRKILRGVNHKLPGGLITHLRPVHRVLLRARRLEQQTWELNLYFI
jgi:hypothetical protein